MHFQKNVFSFCFILLYSISCFSQTNSEIDSSEENYNQAIQFYILDELIAGYKYHFTENSALRLIVNATGLFKDEDLDHIETRNENDSIINTYSREVIISNQFFEIQIQYLQIFEIHEILKIYFGSGPLIGYLFTQNENDYRTSDPETGETYRSLHGTIENTWSVGASVLIGLECNVYNNINLFVEYEAAVSFGWKDYDIYSSSTNYTTNNYDDDINTWSYELKGLRIGAGIYF